MKKNVKKSNHWRFIMFASFDDECMHKKNVLQKKSCKIV